VVCVRKKECGEYYLCIEGEVFDFKCSTGLKFDIKRQICDRAVSTRKKDRKDRSLGFPLGMFPQWHDDYFLYLTEHVPQYDPATII
jgi:hypothetical protein